MFLRSMRMEQRNASGNSGKHGSYPREDRALKAAAQMMGEELLALMGAPVSAMTVMQAKIEKDWRNDANRKTNCDTANVTKAVDAAQEQLAALRTLEAQGRLDTLPEKLLQTALLRREHPEATLSELAELHEPPTSKSTVNHRMRKLPALAAAGPETTAEGPA